MKEVMTYETAYQEVSNFFGSLRKRLPSTTMAMEDGYRKCAEAMQYGYLTISGREVTQVLIEPILNNNGDVSLSEVKYSVPNVLELQKTISASRVKRPNMSEWDIAVLAASKITGCLEAELDKLLSDDKNIMTYIVSFFLI